MNTTTDHQTVVQRHIVDEDGEGRARYVCQRGCLGSWFYSQEFDGDTSLAVGEAVEAAREDGKSHEAGSQMLDSTLDL